jgi:6-phosphofructokinase 1
MPTQEDLNVAQLGEARFASPLEQLGPEVFVQEGSRVAYSGDQIDGRLVGPDVTFERAGARRRIFFDPARTTAAIVTCGGLSPGLNNVIRSVYFELTANYGVPRVLGIREGYRGLNPKEGKPPLELRREDVQEIHHDGGTILSSSRGPQEPEVVVDSLEKEGIDLLFCVGGDGTQRGAHKIAEEVRRRGLAKSIIGIPKTIDNDIPFVWMTFGFATALETAAEVLKGAHVEARGAHNGIGLVKLMGRDAGFIAAGAAVVSQDANFVLVPEVAFPLDGFLEALEKRLEAREHALVVVAEGAGQHLFDDGSGQRDASGNVQHRDVGTFLRDRIEEYFDQRGIEVNLKYIDPSYVIRSVPANAWDRVLADGMARDAVHAAMAGRTDMMIGFWRRATIHVPLPAVSESKRAMELGSEIWTSVMSTTLQPRW